MTAHTDAGARLERLGLLQGQPALPGGAYQGLGQRMFTALVQTGRQAQHLVGIAAGYRNRAVKGRFAFRQRAGFIDNQRVHLAQVLDRGGIAKQHPLRRTLAGGHHDRHRGGQPQGAGAGNDQHRHGIDQPKNPTGLRAKPTPGQEGQQSDGHHGDDKVARHHVGHALHGGAGALRLRHHLHDLRQHGGRAHALRAHHQGAAGVHGGPNQLVAHALADGHRLTGEHGLVHGTATLNDHTIDRHLFTRAHAQAVAHMHVGQGHIFFTAVGADAPGGLGCQTEQGFDRCRGLRARLEFEHLAHQGERNDDGCRLKINGDAPHRDKRVRKYLGRHRRHHAVAISGARAQPDQRPHVGAALQHRLPAAHKKRPTRPQHDGRGQHQFQPALLRHAQPWLAMAEHGQDEHHRGQRQ